MSTSKRVNEEVKAAKVGDILSTRYGEAEVVAVGTKTSRTRTFHTYTIRFKETGGSLTVTRRGLGKMFATLATATPGWLPPLPPEPEPFGPTPPPAYEDEDEEEQACPTPTPQGGLEKLLAEAIGPYVKSSVSRDEVRAIVDERVSQIGVSTVEVVTLDGERHEVGVQHSRFEGLLRLAACGLNTYLVGPAGSGKTTAVGSVAKALGLPFYAKSVGLQTGESALLGYMDANGRYVRTPLREAYEHGGVFLLDEIDSGNAGVLVVLNALLANGHCSFPDGMVTQHKDFRMFAGANTIGQGGDRQYVGKCQLDATTLDRFVFVEFGYDSGIEAARCGVPLTCFGDRPAPFKLNDPGYAGAQDLCEAFCRKVYAVRRAIDSFSGAVRHIVGQRASIHGTTMLRGGFGIEDAVEMCIWKGLDSATRAKVEARV